MWSPGHLPESSSFLHIMARADRKRVLDAGWPFQKTLFVESDLLCWTAVNSGIARDFEGGAYYRIFEATKGVLAGLNDKQLEIVVSHETDELGETERDLRAGGETSPRSLEETKKDHDTRLLPLLYRRFGRSLVEGALAQAHSVTEEMPRIPRMVLSIWLAIFVRERSSHLVQYRFSMTKAMRSRPAKEGFREQVLEVAGFYPDSPPRTILALLLAVAK